MWTTTWLRVQKKDVTWLTDAMLNLRIINVHNIISRPSPNLNHGLSLKIRWWEWILPFPDIGLWWDLLVFFWRLPLTFGRVGCDVTSCKSNYMRRMSWPMKQKGTWKTAKHEASRSFWFLLFRGEGPWSSHLILAPNPLTQKPFGRQICNESAGLTHLGTDLPARETRTIWSWSHR